MMGFKWRVGIAVLGVTLTSCLFRASAVTDDLDATVSSSSLAAPAGSRFVGTSSCSARACHGSVEQPAAGAPVLQNEYITWITKDKRHADAYATLFKGRSKQIAKNLAGGGNPVHAHQDARCLACHSVPAMASDPAGSAALLRDGVSCEACHGPAQKWLAEHYSEGWHEKTDPEKQAADMIPMRKLEQRVQVCVGCHVGSPPDNQPGAPVRDAFHDIMAAGHPRLNFEFGSYLATMPPHWKETAKNARSDFEARAWAIGQVAATDAALKLLEFRANAKDRPWPEFAEYDCFACHHDLREPSWRQHLAYPLLRQKNSEPRKPGFLPWGTWYLPMTRALVNAQPGNGGQLMAKLAMIEELMSAPTGGHVGHRFPDRSDVAGAAHEAAKLTTELLNELGRTHYEDRAAIQHLLAACTRDGKQLVKMNWDAAAQLYNAISALNEVASDGEVKKTLKEMLDQLKLEFPRGYESPQEFHKHFQPGQPDDAGAELGKIRQRFGH